MCTQVACNNTAGWSEWSFPPTAPLAPIGVPEAPFNVEAVAGNASATVTWKSPIDDGGSDIVQYNLTVVMNQSVISFGLSARPTLAVAGLTNGATYSFNVSACNIAGCGPSAPSANSVTPPGYVLPPGPVTSFTAFSLVRAIQLVWTPPENSRYWPVVKYSMSYSVNSSNIVVNVSGLSLQWAVRALQPYVTYDFGLYACNVGGCGPSVHVTGFALASELPPNAPYSVVGLPGDSQVAVNWHMPPDLTSQPVLNCTAVFSDESATGCVALYPSSSCLVTGLVNGVVYSFSVFCSNSAGAGALSLPCPVVTPTNGQSSTPGPPQAVHVQSTTR